MLPATEVHAYPCFLLVETRVTALHGPGVSQLFVPVLQAIKSEGGFVWACK